MLKPNEPQEIRNKMKTIPHFLLLALASVTLWGMPALRATESDPRTGEITKTAEAFVEAFHKGDAKAVAAFWTPDGRSEEHTSELQSRRDLVCRLLLEKKKN